MPDDPSAWLDDPTPKAAAAVNVNAICPTCAGPVQNPTPVLHPLPHVAEAMCVCPLGHTWLTKWVTNTDTGSEDAA